MRAGVSGPTRRWWGTDSGAPTRHASSMSLCGPCPSYYNFNLTHSVPSQHAPTSALQPALQAVASHVYCTAAFSHWPRTCCTAPTSPCLPTIVHSSRNNTWLGHGVRRPIRTWSAVSTVQDPSPGNQSDGVQFYVLTGVCLRRPRLALSCCLASNITLPNLVSSLWPTAPPLEMLVSLVPCEAQDLQAQDIKHGNVY